MNRGGVNLKTVLVMVILLLVGVLGVLGINTVKTLSGSAAAGVEPKNVIAKPDIVNDGGREEFVASIDWVSEKPSIAVVEYGTTPASLLLRAAETDQGTSHSVKLSPLKANTSYYFRIKVGEETFDNAGIPYSFKTKSSSGSSLAPTPTVLLVATVAPTASAGASACNRSTDYNKDGVVNSLDFMVCNSKTVAASPTATTTKNGCKPGVDFDGNGVVNSLDMMKCLQKAN